MSTAPYGGRTLVTDTSAWTNIRKPSAPAQARSEFTAALARGQLRISPVMRLEMTWGARNQNELEIEEALFTPVRELTLTAEIITAAIAGLRSMVGNSPGYQRVPIPDALIAATAQKHGYGVLAYDVDFERLCVALDVDLVWVAPRGSI